MQLIFEKCFIDGEWTDSTDGEYSEVYNPSNHQLIGKVPNCGIKESKQAIKGAHIAFKSWSETLASDRYTYLKNWYDLIIKNVEPLARIMTQEMGKPIKESRAEIMYGASFIEWFMEEAKRVYGDVLPSHGIGKQGFVIKQPVGVVGAITPWNFPSGMITRKVAPALAAGCTIIVKPAQNTPFSALALAELARLAKIPKGVFNVITGKSQEIGLELTTNKLVKKISFTGSTSVGKKLMEQSASTVKKISLELGGNAPFIVFDDADIDLAVFGLIASKFRNTGQTCVCANRIFVHELVHDQFLDKLKSEVAKLKISDGLEEDCDLGPMVNGDAVKKVTSLVSDALAKGAKLEHRSKLPDSDGHFYPATILTNIGKDMDICHEEIFGPVVSMFKFSSVDEVIEKANSTPYGLAAYFYTSNLNLALIVSKKIEAGMVGINDSVVSHTTAPFGGVKESGIGREGSKYGIEEYLQIKFCSFGNIH